MSRPTRRRASRFLGIILVVVAGSGIFAAVKKLGGHKGSGSVPPLLAVDKVESPGFPAAGNASPAFKEGPLLPTTQTPSMATRPTLTDTPLPEVPKTAPAAIEPARIEPPLPISNNPLADGRARFDAGDPLIARRIVNDAMIGGQILGADSFAARELLGKINQQVVFSRRIFKDDPFCAGYTLQSGDRLQRIAANNNITWELICRINGITDPRRVRAFQTIKLIKGPFHAVISKSHFTMDIYLGSPGGSNSLFVMSFPVGLGKDDSTPLGTWKVQGKLKNPTYYSPRGEGVMAADDPKNPLGEYWIGLEGIDGHAVGKMSYGIHGTIDPNSIGKEESMGCIRLKNEDVAMVYELLVEGKSTVMVKE